jgi:hypothetical protein
MENVDNCFSSEAVMVPSLHNSCYSVGLGCHKQRWHYLGVKSILTLNQLDLTLSHSDYFETFILNGLTVLQSEMRLSAMYDV